MNKNLQMIKQVVLDMGGTIEEFMPERSCFYIKFGGKRILLDRNISLVNDSYVSARLTMCKDITYKILHEYKLPTPKTMAFYNKTFDMIAAEAKLEKLNYPIVLKDANGSNSRGVYTCVQNVTEAIKIIKKKLPIFRTMVAQNMVFGKEYRVLVLGKRVIGSLKMIPPYVVGDGVLTVKKLIKIKQFDTKKQTDMDKSLKDILKDQGVSLKTVLEVGRTIYIKKNSCLAEGGETKNVTSLVNNDIKKICVEAARVVGRSLVGVDVICKDISKKPTKGTFFILEINGMPDLSIHYEPTTGKSQNVVKEIVKFMVKHSR